jgi:hypothetical protein
MQHLLVHEVCDEGANLDPLKFYQLLHDYIYDRLRPHSPNYVRHPLILESHDQLRLQLHRSKHSGCYLWQKLPGEIVALHGDKESLQIYLI